MKIVEVQSRYFESLVHLFDAYRVFYHKPTDIEGGRVFLKERIDKKESVIYLAVTETDQVVGFTQLYPIFSSTNMKRIWLLNDLYVDPNFRGQGISKRLIEQSKILARSTHAFGVILETDKTNIIGNQLYPATDFELDIERNHYYWLNKPNQNHK